MKHAAYIRIPAILFIGMLLACGRPAEPSVPEIAPAPTDVPAPTETPEPIGEAEIEIRVEATAEATLPPVPTEAPAPVETAEPVETVAPSPEPVGTPEPTPAPAPITFVASEALPMPDPDDPILKGHPFSVDGTVNSLAPLLSVRAEITDKNGRTVQSAEVTFSESENVTEYHLLDLTFSKDIDCLSEKLLFEKLSAGTFGFRLSARDAQGSDAVLCETTFRITTDSWVRLLPNNLRGNYTTALAFFGSPERFLFKYRFRAADSKEITVEQAWRDRYDAEAVVINGKKWRCHIDAVPYFEQAGRYLESTYIRIHGKNLDTGAVCLKDLVTFNGTIVRRFVNSGAFVSHHSFGTAVDINAHYASNRDVLSNREKIYREVTENLTYNGIVDVKGQLCYDFTYTGSAASGLKRVPEPLMNYLLYELAFYRAGFSWGLYYPHTCDAMHFSLSELSPSYFEEGPYAMRKVFSYIGDEATQE